MGVIAHLEVAGQPLTVPDPSGGTCDAAGNFDRLLPLAQDAYPVLGRIDPHGDLVLDNAAMIAAVAEIDRLLPAARAPIERRGLLRLRQLATHGAQLSNARLIFEATEPITTPAAATMAVSTISHDLRLTSIPGRRT